MAGSQAAPAYGADDQDMSGDPGAAPPDGGDSQGDGGYVIEIRVDANKQISVCVESGSDEASEESGAGAGAAPDGDPDGGDDSGMGDYVPCKSVKEALTLCLEIYRADGKMPQQADDEFQKGFDSQGATAS